MPFTDPGPSHPGRVGVGPGHRSVGFRLSEKEFVTGGETGRATLLPGHHNGRRHGGRLGSEAG